MSAFAFTLAAFGLILVLARLKVPLAAAVVVGAILLGALFGLGPWEIAGAVGAGAIKPMAVALTVVTILLVGLSETMQSSGQLEQIVSLARSFFRRPAVSMAALPALIGLLPMPGGAMFSAPMVASAAGAGKVPGGLLSAVNYWFRHIWEHWWPLYPGVILAVTLTKSGLGAFIAYQLPLGLFMIAGGLVIFRRSHPDLHVSAPAAPSGTNRKLVRATSSIWVIMVVWAATSGAIWAAFGSPPKSAPGEALTAGQERLALTFRFVPITLGLLVSLAWTARLNRMSRSALAKVAGTRKIYTLAVLVVAVMVFQHMIGRVDAAPRIGEELRAINVPAAAVVALLPFIAGFVTGLAVGFVGTSFPIVVSLVEAMPDAPALRPYAVLAYASGHLGMMLSPLHLCHIVSNEYFKTPFAPVYRRLLPAAATTALLAAGYVLVLMALMR